MICRLLTRKRRTGMSNEAVGLAFLECGLRRPVIAKSHFASYSAYVNTSILLISAFLF